MKKIIILLALFLVSCTHFEPQLATQSIYYEDSAVELSRLMVYTRPQKPHYKPLSALFYPYHVTQGIPNGRFWGQQIGKLVWENWTGLQLFPSMVYDDNLAYRGLEDALFTARNRGYDLLIVGFVPYLYLGHTVDSSALTIQVKIYETQHGQMLCSFEQSGRIDKRMDDDFIVFKRTHRMPDSALYSITQAISGNMAVPLTSWALFESSSAGMTSALTAAMQKAEQEQKEQVLSYQQQEEPQPKEFKTLESENTVLKPAALPQPEKQPSINLAIQFDKSESTIDPKSLPILNELGKALNGQKLKDKKVTITGHTDSDASKEFNMKLSKDRAEAVKKYLIDNFMISPDRLITRGVGSTQPLVPDTSEYNKQFNRRVQITLSS
ncbi:OmpA family protein [Maridesulfovibrio bastinii]|uniref:OmpA family protein n=1 Tax=Maridesulfovibrio bastinii TaxID=47157 RepID=UPI0004293690|nr:OmpA family protein [Maridesulfovibrio bastinii]